LAVGLVAAAPAEAQAPHLTEAQKIKQMSPKSYAFMKVESKWLNPKREFVCLDRLWHKESGWNHKARNPHSSAFGIPQFLDSTWENYKYPVRPKDPQVQIDAGLRYIYKRYQTPCQAWDFWKRQAGPDLRGGWY
jgi:hypothetical protein